MNALHPHMSVGAMFGVQPRRQTAIIAKSPSQQLSEAEDNYRTAWRSIYGPDGQREVNDNLNKLDELARDTAAFWGKHGGSHDIDVLLDALEGRVEWLIGGEWMAEAGSYFRQSTKNELLKLAQPKKEAA